MTAGKIYVAATNYHQTFPELGSQLHESPA